MQSNSDLEKKSKNDKEPSKKLLQTLANCIKSKDSTEYYIELINYREKEENSELFKKMLDFFIAVGNQDRLLILSSLKKKERCVCELEILIGKSQPAVSHHLRILVDAGLIKGRKQNKFTYFTLVKEKYNELTLIWNKWIKDVDLWAEDFTNINNEHENLHEDIASSLIENDFKCSNK